MKSHRFGIVLVVGAALAGNASARGSHDAPHDATPSAPKPWCAPEVSELSDHVCYFDGETAANGTTKSERHTLVIYLHGMLATTQGFQYLQQRAVAIHAKRNGFTVLMPTSPRVDNAYMWPNSVAAQKKSEAETLTHIEWARGALEERIGHRFDDTFVVGFSSGAYYASSLAARSALDVSGYAVFAGGSPIHARNDGAHTKHAPVFVGVSAADAQTADDSRSLANSLAALRWPYRVEEREVGHMVDGTLLAHALHWLRDQRPSTVPTQNF